MPGPGWWARAVPAACFWCAVYVYATLPDVRPLVRENPQRTAFMRMRQDEAAQQGLTTKLDVRWVPYNRISEQLKRAVLVAEDSAFWQHDGIDFEQLRESMEVNFERMEFARGASTITQQLAKNLYLSPSRNPVRKVREWMITRRLEAVVSKRRILELYLNLIEWGDGIWGAEAAARRYFRKPASTLSNNEAALLAGAIINPRVLSPARPSARLLRRQSLVLRRMIRAAPPAEAANVVEPPHQPPESRVPETAPITRDDIPADPSPEPLPPDEPTVPEVAPALAPELDSTP